METDYKAVVAYGGDKGKFPSCPGAQGNGS